jgi:large subunit ribosomal protein L23
MAILDIFKKRKKITARPKPVPAEPAPQEEKEAPQEPTAFKKEEKIKKAPEAKRRRIRKRGKVPQSYKVLKIPHVTEKATDLTKENKYVFRVWPGSNKIEIKKTIEDLYDVDVISVKIINVPSKQRRLGRTLGWRKGYKKAIVKIKEGQKIEVLPR